MKTETSQRILDYIEQNSEVTVKQLVDFLEFSPQAVHRQLKKLLYLEKLKKFGSSPKVFYRIQKKLSTESLKESIIEDNFPQAQLNIIDKSFYYINPSGQQISGFAGFVKWCWEPGRNFEIEKTAKDYTFLVQQYEKLKDSRGIIDVIEKVKATFGKEVYLDEVWSLDYYALPRFGKTKLAAKLFYAKLSQDKTLISEIVEEVKPYILELISRKNIQTVGFIPPSVYRKVQFMAELKKGLNLNIPLLSIEKITKAKDQVAVQQKTLKKKEERIENAKNTIYINDQRAFENVLLVDDFIGSAATLNQVAKKIKEKKLSDTVFGLGLTSSIKGFEVIKEV